MSNSGGPDHGEPVEGFELLLKYCYDQEEKTDAKEQAFLLAKGEGLDVLKSQIEQWEQRVSNKAGGTITFILEETIIVGGKPRARMAERSTVYKRIGDALRGTKAARQALQGHC